MDALSLALCGHVGSKIKGLFQDKYGRDCYGFSLCVNYRHGNDESLLWVQATVREAGLLQICLERGIYTGEKLMLTSTEVTQDAGMYNGKPRAYLNMLVQGLVFLTEKRPDVIVNVSGVTPRIIQFEELDTERKTG